MKILITGYYDRNNYGDDMYQSSFPKVFPKDDIIFVDINKLNQYTKEILEKEKFNLVVLGGGDVLTHYFLNIFNKWYYENQLNLPCHAYSVGVPYLSIIESGEIDIFDYIVCRNKADAELLQKRFGDKHISYLPDFVFIEPIKPLIQSTKSSYSLTQSLTQSSQSLTQSSQSLIQSLNINEIQKDHLNLNFSLLLKNKPIVSIFLARPCINDIILSKLAIFLNDNIDKYHFIAYPLNTNQNNLNENDYLQSLELKNMVHDLEVSNERLDFDGITNLLNKSYFSICVRLHAHIFSIMTTTPFISLYSTRKVRNLLDDFNLNHLGTSLILNCQYCKEINQPPKTSSLNHLEEVQTGCMSCKQMCGKPVDMVLDDLDDLHHNIIFNYKDIKKQLIQARNNNLILLKNCNSVCNSNSNLNFLSNKSFKLSQYLTYNLIQLPNLIKRTTCPYFINCKMIEDKKNKIFDSIFEYLIKYFNFDINIIKKISNKIKNNQLIVKDIILIYNNFNQNENLNSTSNSNSNKLNEYSRIEIELSDLICWLITGIIRPKFHYGLLEQIGKDTYNISESIEYLIKEYNKEPRPERFINLESKINMYGINQERLIDLHYSGWNYVINGMNKKLDNPNGIMLNGFIDKTFHWEYDFNSKIGIIPYREKWVGFLHHALDQNYSPYNCIELFNKPLFLESLKVCCGIYVFSEYLKNWVINILKEKGISNVKVENLIHPTKTPDITFNYLKFLNNNNKSVIQIGGWYRNSYAIYELKSYFNKIVLKGLRMDNYFKPLEFDFDDILKIKYNNNTNTQNNQNQTQGCGIESCGFEYHSSKAEQTENKYLTGMVSMLKRNYEKVKILENVSNLEFDLLLSQNIVFLELIDCSASNTVIECLIRNTPLLINSHPAIIELFGINYPFYYKTYEEANKKSDDIDLIYKTHIYLKKIPKTILNIKYFIDSIKQSKIYKSISL